LDQRPICIGPKANGRAAPTVVGVGQVGNPGQRRVNVMSFTHKPGAGIEVDVNGKMQGTVEGDDFAKAFLAIWLGAKPPNPNLKAGLLGDACG
jgi:hypothetical protein